MARAVSPLLGFACCFGLYLVLAGSLSRNELITGAVAAGGCGALVAVLRLRLASRMRLPVPPPHALARPLAALVLDTVKVGLVLLRAVGRRPAAAVGGPSPQPFRGMQGSRSDAGRRALVVLGCSVAPNGYVLDGSWPEQSLLLHRLSPVEAEQDRDWPT